MKRSIKEVASVLLVVAVVVVGSWTGASNVWAQDKGASLAQQIQGTWTLVSIYNELDGKKTDVFGSNPKGSMILSPNGRFSLIIIKAGLPKFAANNRVKGTAEENQAAVQGSIGYFGTYTVAGDKDITVNLRIEGSTYPNFDGENQKRFITISGDEMKFTNPTAGVGGSNHLVWKRAK